MFFTCKIANALVDYNLALTHFSINSIYQANREKEIRILKQSQIGNDRCRPR